MCSSDLVCIQNLPVVFAIDRAGIVGSDGETHQGIFDLSFLSSIPNMHIMAPKNKWELSDMLKFAVECNVPIAVRYPRGEAYDKLEDYREPLAMGKSEMIYQGSEIALVAIGSMVKTAVEIREELLQQDINCTLINGRFVKPIDVNMLETIQKTHSIIVTLEENVSSGGFGEKVREFYMSIHSKAEVITIHIPDAYVEHGNVEALREEIEIDKDSIIKKIKEVRAGL